MGLKKVLAGEVVTVLYGVAAAMTARAGFTAQFSRRSCTDVESLPAVDATEHGGEGIATVLAKVLEFQPSASAARRVAKQNGLRLVIEPDDGSEQRSLALSEQEALRPLAEVTAEKLAAAGTRGTVYLKAGRKIATIRGL